MRHVEKALARMVDHEGNIKPFISIENAEDVVGVPPIVKFQVQSDPISMVGVNGCQASDMLHYVKCLFESLNDAFPCYENEKTIEHIKSAMYFQEERTKNRVQRGVEGKNEA